MPNTEKQMTAIQEVMAIIEMEHNNGVEISQKVLWGMLNKALATERKQLIDFGAGCIDKSKKSDLFETKNIAKQNYFNTFKTQ